MQKSLTAAAATTYPPRNFPVEGAIAMVKARAIIPEGEAVPLKKAYARVLFEDVRAVRDQPPFAASAMDGYAVARESLDTRIAPLILRVVGQSLAGQRYLGRVEKGEAVRIFTGAPVPEGCDTIIVQEDTSKTEGGISILPDGVREVKNYIRPSGQDFRAGEALLDAGERLDPWRLSLAAAAGRDMVMVTRRPRIAVLCNGDELVRPGVEPDGDQIFESASFALIALIKQWGGKAAYLGVEKDDTRAIFRALRDLDVDLIVTVGGASVGDLDLVKPALGKLGLVLDFESLNVRPGKPTSFGTLDNGIRVLTLPGNPASAFVVAQLLLKPWIEASLGLASGDPFVRAVCMASMPSNGARETYLRAQLGCSDAGQLQVTPFLDQDSSLVSVFARADALIRLAPHQVALATGDLVECLPLDRL